MERDLRHGVEGFGVGCKVWWTAMERATGGTVSWQFANDIKVCTRNISKNEAIQCNIFRTIVFIRYLD
jgi:hypothetical protein